MLTYTQTIKRRRGGGRDRFGDPLPTTLAAIDGCVVWPSSSSEQADFSQQVTTGYQMSVPPGADLVATDEILLPVRTPAGAWVLPAESAGPWWQIDGDALPWGPSPFTGWEPGMIVSLTRSTG